MKSEGKADTVLWKQRLYLGRVSGSSIPFDLGNSRSSGRESPSLKKKKERAMPFKAPHPCAKPGCRELTHHRYCEKHQAEANANYNKHYRDKERQKFYNSQRWEAVRAEKLRKDPFCEECRKGGTLIKATVVDHIVEIKDGGSELDIDNLQSLCWSCHSRMRRAKQQSGANRKRRERQTSTFAVR